MSEQQCKVETVEEFKLRFAAIIGDKPEHIPDAPPPHSAAGPPQGATKPPEIAMSIALASCTGTKSHRVAANAALI
jgi:hypothetical protein